MPTSKRDKARLMLVWLRSTFPTAYPVTVQLTRLPPDRYADCRRKGRRFDIRLDERMPWVLMLDSLLHEYAHAMSWPHSRVERKIPPHSDEWGLAYARLIRTYFDHEEGPKL